MASPITTNLAVEAQRGRKGHKVAGDAETDIGARIGVNPFYFRKCREWVTIDANPMVLESEEDGDGGRRREVTEDTSIVVERIRTLLRLAKDSGAFEGEVANAMAAANALLTKHNLSRGSIELNRATDTSDVTAKQSRQVSNLEWRQSLRKVA